MSGDYRLARRWTGKPLGRGGEWPSDFGNVTNIRPVTKQHTVTKRILKEFADPNGRLAVFDLGTGMRQLRSPGAGIFTTQFDSYDSRGAEARWSIFETRFPGALARVRSRTALADSATVDTLKDLLALHWARSSAIKVARDRISAQVVEEHKRSMVRERPDLLRRGLLREVGLVASSRSELEWLSDKLHDRVAEENSAKWHSHRDPQNFAAARTHFESLHVQIGFASGHDLLISDSPVISTIQGREGVGPHQGIGILSADHIAMPLAPDVLIGLGPKADLMTLSDDVVDHYNRWQWDACVNWIAARPSGTADVILAMAHALAAVP